MAKLFSMDWTVSTSFPSTPTLVHWFRAMKKLESSSPSSTALDIMNKAIEMGWKTKNEGNDKRLMETWAYYVKDLKELGLQECGDTGKGKKSLSLEELLGE